MSYDTEQSSKLQGNAMPSNEAGPPTSPHAPAPTASASAGKRGGAHHVTHGLYGSGLPRGAQRVGRRLSAFRRSLCEAVEARAGEIDLHAAATVDSACQWQRHALLAARWLRIQHDELSPDQRLAFSREVAKASTERDRCIRLLGLQQAAAAFDARCVYDHPITLEDLSEAPPASNLAAPDDSYARPHPGAISPADAPASAVGDEEPA